VQHSFLKSWKDDVDLNVKIILNNHQSYYRGNILKANNLLQQILQSIGRSFLQMEETLPNYFFLIISLTLNMIEYIIF